MQFSVAVRILLFTGSDYYRGTRTRAPGRVLNLKGPKIHLTNFKKPYINLFSQLKKKKNAFCLSLFRALNVYYFKYAGVTHHTRYRVQYHSVFLFCNYVLLTRAQKWDVSPVGPKMTCVARALHDVNRALFMHLVYAIKVEIKNIYIYLFFVWKDFHTNI